MTMLLGREHVPAELLNFASELGLRWPDEMRWARAEFILSAPPHLHVVGYCEFCSLTDPKDAVLAYQTAKVIMPQWFDTQVRLRLETFSDGRNVTRSYLGQCPDCSTIFWARGQ